MHVSDQDLRQQFDLLMNIRGEMSRVYEAVNQIEDVRLQLAELKKRLPPDDPATQKVKVEADDLNGRLLAVRDTLLQMKVRANEDSLAYPQQADAKLAYLALVVGGRTDSAPTAAAAAEFEKLKGMTDGFLANWTQLQKSELSAFQREMAEQKHRSGRSARERQSECHGRAAIGTASGRLAEMRGSAPGTCRGAHTFVPCSLHVALLL